ncbi:MAG: UPF0182 family protein [Actinomycetota bacterium]
MRRPEGRRIQRRWFVIGGILLLLVISVSSVVRMYTDVLWFDELGFTTVFWKILWTRVGVGVVGGAGAALLVFANLEVARRAAPHYRFVTPGTDIAEQYRSAFRPYARLANIGLALVVGFFTGISTSATWERFLLWRNAKPFGVTAPAPFGQDASFYVFGMPFQRSLLSWLFGVLIASLLLSGVAHLLHGSIQPEQNRIRVASVVKVHLSVLLGLIALLKAWAYRLDLFDLVFSARGTVTGASYTDINAQLPALRLLMYVAIIVAVIFFVNVFRFQGWLIPGVALGLWAFSSILLGGVWPAAVQRFQVTPNESTRERPFIERNIEATRTAFGLDRIEVEEFPAEETLTEETVAENEGTVDNVRVWDPTVLAPTYQRLQAIRSYYDFDDIDIDRYQLNDQTTQVMLAAREVDASQLSPSWVNLRLTYTHGYGLVANQANAVSEEGLPEFLVQGLPPRGPDAFQVDQPGIYYGERLTGYAVANSGQEEIDFPRGEQEVVTTNYEGGGGIPLSNMLRRLAFAVRFGDTDMVLSSFIRPDSRVIFRRNIVERVSAAAPFLQFDHDPYLVVADRKHFWVMDAYTSTDRFPYSERMNLEQAVGGNLRGQANYLRNSVKAVVDAYDGTTTFYVVDDSDAMIATYQSAFPELFVSGDRMPAELREHLRYPEELFKVQALQYRAYHILEPQRLYEREDVWDVPNDPVTSTAAQRVAMEPYYVVQKLPGEDNEEFLLMLPFTPRDRPNLNGWVAARMDGDHYGELVAFSFPRGTSIEGPENISARINQNDEIAEQFTLWDRAGSTVVHGNMLVIPMGQTLIYVQPIYLRAEEEARSLPELRKVIVVVGNRIGFENTFRDSLDAVMRGVGPTAEEEDVEPPATEPEEEAPAPELSGDVAELLGQAVDHFERADAALREGDLATYQRENEAGRQAVEQAQEQSGD